MTRSTLEELLARCERATGSDRKLDAEIYCAANPTWRPDENISGQVLGIEFRSLKGAPLLTSSIDAIVALIERELPGAHLLIDQWHESGATCSFLEKGDDGEWWSNATGIHAQGATRALACCAAYLRAKLSSGGDE